MDDVVLKGIGFWLLALAEAGMIYLAFWIAQFVDGISPELYILVCTVMAGCTVLLNLLIKFYFKIETEEFINESIL